MQIRTHVADEPNANGCEATIGIGSKFDVLNLTPAMDGRLAPFRPRLRPANRQVVFAGEGNAEEFFGVDVEFGPEPSANRGRDNTHLVFGYAERQRDHDFENVRNLRRRVQRHVAPERLGNCNDCSRFHRCRNEALLDVPLFHRVGGGGEGGVNVTLLLLNFEIPCVRLIRSDLIVNDDSIADCVFEIDHRLERFVDDIDEFCSVASSLGGLSNHACDSVADVVRLGHCERQVRWILHVGGHRPCAGHRSGPQVCEIGTGVCGSHTGVRARRGGVDRHDSRASVWTSDHRKVKRTRYRKVRGEPGLSSQESRIFLSKHPSAKHSGCFMGHRHRSTPVMMSTRCYLLAHASTACTMLW